MSALGQKRTSPHRAMSALPPKADIVGRNSDVRFVPKATFCTAADNPRTLLGLCAYPATVRSILVPSDCSLILPRCWFRSCAVRNHPVADLLPQSTLKPPCTRRALAAHISGEADSASAPVFRPLG